MEKSSNERQTGRFLASYELALPAICGRTGKVFAMIAARKPGEILELVRSIAIQDEASRPEMQRFDRDGWPQLQPGADALASPISGSQDKPEEFQAIMLYADVEIGDNYSGCPYCRSTGFFYCSKCGLFSCWNQYNQKQHGDHHDSWCEGCKSWRCFSNEADEDSRIELTAFAGRAIQGISTQRCVEKAGVDRPLLPPADPRRLR